MAEYQFPTGLSFGPDVEGTQPTTDDDIGYTFPTGLSFGPVIEEPEEEPKSEGIFANMVKGFKDLVDYSAISLEVAEHGITGGSDEIDIDQVVARVKSINDRAANFIVSQSHKELVDVFHKEGPVSYTHLRAHET